MNAPVKKDASEGVTEVAPVTGLALLREPFPDHQISKLPKPTPKQSQEVKDDFKKGVRCKLCNGWHHPETIHLDYVGHAALTDRLLNADPMWDWQPLATTDQGAPLFDSVGGLWIKLTVCGVTRLGYGHAGDKKGGDAVKEIIGDALRNAAMRFGAALDLWHKGDLHGEPEDQEKAPADKAHNKPNLVVVAAETAMTMARSRDDLTKWRADNEAMLGQLTTDEHDAIKRAFKHRWTALAPEKEPA
jgi:hypothetical protein